MDNPTTPEQVVSTPGIPASAAPAQPVVETPQGTPQQQARQDVYNQYASLYQQPTAPETPATPEPAAPAPTPEPPAEDTRFQELYQVVEELKRQNQELTSRLPAPPPPTTPEPAIHPLKKWVELMAADKLDEAEEFFLQAYGPKIAAKVQPQLVQTSVEANRAEVEIEKFVNQFETSNQDLLPMRDYVVLGAERRLAQAQHEGKIKTPADFVVEYKKAVTDEANALREKFQMARGAGREEALTTQRTVLSATTLPPSQLQQPTQNNNSQQPSTPTDYMAMRRNLLAQKMGLGTT